MSKRFGGLGMGAAVPRYFQNSTRSRFGTMSCNVAQGQDPNQAVVPRQDRNPADAGLAHAACDVIQVLVVEAEQHFLTQDFANRRIGALAGGDCADGNVAIRDHADEQAVFCDRQHTGADLGHYVGAVTDTVPWIADAHMARHGFAHSHGLIDIRCRVGFPSKGKKRHESARLASGTLALRCCKRRACHAAECVLVTELNPEAPCRRLREAGGAE